MIISKKALNRRTLLRGFGTALGLPLFDAMVPALTHAARTAAAPINRMAFCYVPNGIIMNHWTPQADGKTIRLWASDHEGWLTMQGDVALS